MTPKEKAEELFDNMYQVYDMSNYNNFEIDESDNDINSQLWEKNNELYKNIYKQFAKECTLIAVQEIMDSEPQYKWTKSYEPNDYWAEVKQEIENL